jgi:hypothetical protein
MPSDMDRRQYEEEIGRPACRMLYFMMKVMTSPKTA